MRRISDRTARHPSITRGLGAFTLAVTCGVAALLACGFEFPLDVLSSRGTAMLQAPEATFNDEVWQLVPPPDDGEVLKPVEDRAWSSDEPEPVTPSRTEAEAEGLSPDAVSRIAAMRQHEDGASAFAAGEGLPPDVRNYTAGAVSYQHQQLDAAQEYFQSVLALPRDERRHRELWARFMLGRTASLHGDVAEATAHFEATRALVRSGVPDRLGLAVASLGEEARLHLKPGGIARAVKLYAQQASYGSASGGTSLLRVADAILADEAWLDEAIQDSLSRRLLFLYLNARVYRRDPFYDEGPVGDLLPQGEPQDPDAPLEPGAEAAGTLDTTAPPSPTSVTKPALDRVVDALDRHRITDRAGMGWLAATAYQAGRFDLAERLAGRDTAALSSWIRAKLAWRRGDAAAALAGYTEALAAYQREHRGSRQHAELIAEAAVLRLGRDEFVEALTLLLAASDGTWSAARSDTDYWRDVAYIAERVLTVDELKQYVDERVKTPTGSEVEEALEKGETLPGASLRDLLARRLMREQRYGEAIGYFDDEHIRSVAEEYVAALSRAGSWWRSAVSRAENWFAAATIARFDGMEVLGYELSPDFAVFDGQVALDDEGNIDFDDEPDADVSDAGTSDSSSGSATGGPTGVAATPGAAAASSGATEAGGLTAAERERVARSAPSINTRFHYRLIAVDHAMRAADVLPPSSQAFAAVLCRANSWIINREPERAATVYARYLQEGAYVPWARQFGRRCPQPDFEGAARRAWAVRIEAATGVVRSHPLLSGVAGLVAAGALVVTGRGLARRRRQGATGDESTEDLTR